YALANVAAQRGADVHLIAGHTEDLPTPSGARVTRISSALELKDATENAARDADVVIMAAAVADYRPAQQADSKLKKGGEDQLEVIELVENPDILAGLVELRRAGELPESLRIVGFAAETGDAESTPLEHAQQKFLRKGCDLLIANAVGRGKVFGQEDSAGWLIDYPSDSDNAAGLHVRAVPAPHQLEVAGAILNALPSTNGQIWTAWSIISGSVHPSGRSRPPAIDGPNEEYERYK